MFLSKLGFKPQNLFKFNPTKIQPLNSVASVSRRALSIESPITHFSMIYQIDANFVNRVNQNSTYQSDRERITLCKISKVFGLICVIGGIFVIFKKICPDLYPQLNAFSKNFTKILKKDNFPTHFFKLNIK